MIEPDRLAAAALRLSASDPIYVGYWLDRYTARGKLAPAALAARLGVTPAKLPALALCRAPAAEETFVADVEALCAFSGADFVALANLLKQEQSLAVWASPTPAPASNPSAAAGWHVAAHDADQPPPRPEGDGDDNGGGDAHARRVD